MTESAVFYNQNVIGMKLKKNWISMMKGINLSPFNKPSDTSCAIKPGIEIAAVRFILITR